MLVSTIERQHASENSKLHALHAYHFLGLIKTKVATVYRKAPSTVSALSEAYEKTGSVARQFAEVLNQKYNAEKREWLRCYISRNPLSYLDETKHVSK